MNFMSSWVTSASESEFWPSESATEMQQTPGVLSDSPHKFLRQGLSNINNMHKESTENMANFARS